MSEVFCQQAAEYKKQVEDMSLGREFKRTHTKERMATAGRAN